MSLLLLSTGRGGVGPTYADDVFATTVYSGTSAARDIVNGIDLSGQGGMVWTKDRNSSSLGWSHNLWDTSRGPGKTLLTDGASAEYTFPTGVTAFKSTGYSLGTDSQALWNTSGKNYVSWAFRKAGKFFDVVAWTGNAVGGRKIPHGLGIAPGMIIVKCLDDPTGGTDGYWFVYHRALPSPESGSLFMNTTDMRQATNAWANTLPTSTEFSVDDGSYTNRSGKRYVAYLFAHDESPTGQIRCGLIGTGTNELALGWKPQYVMIKSVSIAAGWGVGDTARGLNTTSTGGVLFPHITEAESTNADWLRITPNGFSLSSGSSPVQWVYMAIREKNKP